MLTIALDIGGTFTDLTALDDAKGTIFQAKSSTTPAALETGIERCIKKSGLDIALTHSFIHGSTIAINTAIERTGARTGLIVTKGTRDVYQIGRGNRPESYNVFFKRPLPYVPRHLVFEVDERLNSAGEVILALGEEDVKKTVENIKSSGVEAVAVCFLHSYANSDHEKRVGNILRDAMPSAYISLSHEVLSEYGEYERTSTTVLNSYLGPRVSHYLDRLEVLLGSLGFSGHLLIMQSNGGVMTASVARNFPVRMMESGPVGGIVAAAEVGLRLGFSDVIAFDMGGTTAKTSLVRHGEMETAQGYYIGGYASGQPVMSPVVDVVEVGAGGGSIAWIDEVGALKVGPRSAGGHPGPICYGWGGKEPTVTDANVVLGRIGPSSFLGGEIPLNAEAAYQGIANRVAEQIGLDPIDSALGILRIATAQMSLAVRGVSVERGYDPRDFALVACGGAGPLHAVQIARELHVPIVIVPRLPAHFSALGMLLTDLRHDYVQTQYERLENADFTEIQRIITSQVEEAKNTLEREGVDAANMMFQPSLDIRYVGQDFYVQTPVSEETLEAKDIQAIRQEFDNIHERRYGHEAPHEPVEIVNVRLTARGRRRRPQLPSLNAVEGEARRGTRKVFLEDMGKWVDCPIYDRELLGSGQEVQGPAVIEEYASTTLLFSADVARVADTGELLVTVGSSE